MKKCLVSMLTAAAVAMSFLPAVHADSLVFNKPLYRSAFDSIEGLEESGLRVKSGTWKLVQDETGAYLESADVTAALMVDGVNAVDTSIEIEYEQSTSLNDNQLYYSGSSADNYMLKNTFYLRSGAALNTGTGFYKWMFTNPGQYSNKSFQGYYGPSSVVNNNYESTAAESKVKPNQRQKVVLGAKEKDGTNTLLSASLNDVFSMDASHWHSAASVAGTAGLEFRVVLGANHAGADYAVKVYSIKVNGFEKIQLQEDLCRSSAGAYEGEHNGAAYQAKDYGYGAKISEYKNSDGTFGFYLTYTDPEDGKTYKSTIPYSGTIPEIEEGSALDIKFGIEVRGVPALYEFQAVPYIEKAQ